MKVIKIITHPYTIIISFLLIVISGEHWGGFYLLYLLLALPHGGVHALLAMAGVALLLITYHHYKRKGKPLIVPILNIAGVLMLLLSLFLFFYNDKQEYNYGTFYQTVPQLTLVLFLLLAVGFISINVYKGISRKNNDSSLSYRSV